MQNSLKFLMFSLGFLLMLTACGKDEENCDLNSIEKTIVGKWVYPLTNETVEFQADGTLIDPDNSTIATTSTEGETEKSWQVDSNGNIEVSSSNGNSSNSATVIIDGFTCDKIMTTFFGFPRTMERE